MEDSPHINQIPAEPTVSRFRVLWRVLLIFNFGLGAYMFIQRGKKERDKQKVVAPVSAPAAVTPPVEEEEEPKISLPVERPVPVRQPIPEDQQREIFKWILEEKRKVKPQNREEKKRLDEEKAILKEFIRSESIPRI